MERKKDKQGKKGPKRLKPFCPFLPCLSFFAFKASYLAALQPRNEGALTRRLPHGG
jgi:hypothetical protein